jgi:hypothetical protein
MPTVDSVRRRIGFRECRARALRGLSGGVIFQGRLGVLLAEPEPLPEVAELPDVSREAPPVLGLPEVEVVPLPEPEVLPVPPLPGLDVPPVPEPPRGSAPACAAPLGLSVG